MPIQVDEMPGGDKPENGAENNRIGQVPKAKLSDKWRNLLSPRQLNFARYIIRCMRYTDNNGIGAEGYVEYRDRTYHVVVHPYAGNIKIDGKVKYRQATKAKSLGDAICNALYNGAKLFDDKPVLDSSGVEVDPEWVKRMLGDSVDKPKPIEPAKPVLKGRELLFERFIELRRFTEREDGANDIMSTRSLLNSAKMLDLGIPVEAIMHNLTLTWPDEAKRRCKIQPYDQTTFSFDPDKVENTAPENVEKVRHKVLDYALGIAHMRLPMLMVGPAGCGKTHLAEQLADEMDLRFRSISVTSGMSVSWLAGRVNIHDKFIETGLIECFTKGGIFLLDEIDAGESNTLLFLNQAIANGVLEIPSTGQRYERHGANRDYQGRNPLDGATLDRFKATRIPMTYDEDMERKLVVG
jgi:hypothetical protein